MVVDAPRMSVLLVGASIAFIAAIPLEPHRIALRVEAPGAVATDDAWTETDVVVGSEELGELIQRGVQFRVLVDDVDRVAEEERARLASRHDKEWFAEYRDGAELDAFIDRLAAEHSSTVKVRTVGWSHEGRAIRALRVSRGAPMTVVIDGGHHAREWLSVMVPACMADRLARAEDPRIARVLAKVSFVIAPLVNPDGYAYSWSTDRYWRKNRHGEGVDLGRNYSVGWGGAGSSGDPRSPNYRGEYAFSEPETRAVRRLFDGDVFDERAIGRVAAHVDLHAYSQVIVYPWSHTREQPEHERSFAAIADRMSRAIAQTHDATYEVRPGSTLARGAGGTAGDWSYGERDALSFLVELRPASAGEGGFVVPPDQIVPTCDETLNGVLALGEWLIEDHSGESSVP